MNEERKEMQRLQEIREIEAKAKQAAIQEAAPKNSTESIPDDTQQNHGKQQDPGLHK